jgi:Cytochrome c554 and c-prime
MHGLAWRRGAPVVVFAALGCHPASPMPARHDAAEPTMPGPIVTAPVSGRVALNDGCVTCHTPQAAEWRASQHRSAHDDPDFLRAMLHERQSFCRSCHAPEADPARTPERSVGAIGVACVTCHLPHGIDPADGTLAVPGRSTPDAAPGHALLRVEAFAGVDACGGCHEFSFPRVPALAMQSTLTEHAQSRFAAVPCAECHMPWVGEGPQRHRSHAFAASRDPVMLGSAVDVRAERAPGGRIVLQLTPGRIGHAFPTGDLFRRLWVDVEAVDADGDGVAYDGQALARHFAGPGRPLVLDNRPGAPAQHAHAGVVDVTFELGAEVDARAIVWRVLHQRVELPLAGDDAEIFGETVVHEGRLEAAGTAP